MILIHHMGKLKEKGQDQEMIRQARLCVSDQGLEMTTKRLGGDQLRENQLGFEFTRQM